MIDTVANFLTHRSEFDLNGDGNVDKTEQGKFDLLDSNRNGYLDTSDNVADSFIGRSILEEVHQAGKARIDRHNASNDRVERAKLLGEAAAAFTIVTAFSAPNFNRKSDACHNLRELAPRLGDPTAALRFCK